MRRPRRDPGSADNDALRLLAPTLAVPEAESYAFMVNCARHEWMPRACTSFPGVEVIGGADILVCLESVSGGHSCPPERFESARRDRNVPHSRIRADRNVCPTKVCLHERSAYRKFAQPDTAATSGRVAEHVPCEQRPGGD